MFLSLLISFLAKGPGAVPAGRWFVQKLRAPLLAASGLKTVLLPRLMLLLLATGLAGCTFEAVKPPPQTYSSFVTAKHGSLQSKETSSELDRAAEGDSSSSLEFKLMKASMNEPLSPENTNELLNEVGSNWLFGQGMGETAATIGTIVVFPPYALWVLGNAALQLSGEEPIEVSRILPEESGKVWRTTYDEITSVPGRTTAAVAGETYRSQEVARDRIEAVLDKNSKDLAAEKRQSKINHEGLR